MRRIAVVLVVVLVVCALPAVAIASFPWSKPFSRTAEDVMGRFNQLSKSWGQLRVRAGEPKSPGIPGIEQVRFDTKTEFGFCSKDHLGFENESASYDITGEIDPAQADKVVRLSIQIDATEQLVTPEYLTSCDRLMQLTLFSLFDGLDEKATRDLSLLFAYDIRPFISRSVDKALPDSVKVVDCVINRQLVSFRSFVSGGNHIEMHVSFGEAATPQQAARSNDNVSCNRKLSQANIECTELNDCTERLSLALEDEEPDWAELAAVCNQLEETTEVIRELHQLLQEYDKAILYASRIASQCQQFQDMNHRLTQLIAARDLEGAEQQVLSMQTSANLMQMLISSMLT